MHYQQDPGRRAWASWADRRVVVGIGAIVVAVALAVVVIASGGPWGDDPKVEASAARPDVETTTSTTARPTTTTAKPRPTTTVPPTTTPPTTRPAPASTAPVPPPTMKQVPQAPPTAATAGVSGTGALCVGDSIMLSASARYYDTLSMCGVTDAKVGRQLAEGIPVVASHAPYPGTVIVHLGTNGTVTSSQLDSLLRYVSGVPRVVLVTVQLNGVRSWEAADNAAIKAAAGRWGNVRIADWNAVSEGHGSWFGADSIHLTSSGAQAYASTIAAAL